MKFARLTPASSAVTAYSSPLTFRLTAALLPLSGAIVAVEKLLSPRGLRVFRQNWQALSTCPQPSGYGVYRVQILAVATCRSCRSSCVTSKPMYGMTQRFATICLNNLLASTAPPLPRCHAAPHFRTPQPTTSGHCLARRMGSASPPHAPRPLGASGLAPARHTPIPAGAPIL